MDRIEIKAFEFLKKYGTLSNSCDKLRKIIESQGFTIIEYSHFSNDNNIETLLNSLNLKTYSLEVNAFTYVDSTMRLVFILEGLSDEETLILLSHEEGHIYLKHFLNNDNLFGYDIISENEANKFSYFIRKTTFSLKIRQLLKSKKFIIIFSAVVSALLASGIVYTHYINTHTFYYITPTGSKYHTKNCEYISKHKKTRITKEEAERFGYDPCYLCIK